jgi:hypothetical protein
MDWYTLFRRFEATVDMPACLYYQELLQAFPDGKVVLTVWEPDRRDRGLRSEGHPR